MVWGYFFLVFIVLSILWIMAQRIVKRHRVAFRVFVMLFTIVWGSWRFDQFQWEMIWGFIASLFLSFLFWLLIGRYNPVGNADDENIKVYGLDD
jgi:hypothetical protein